MSDQQDNLQSGDGEKKSWPLWISIPLVLVAAVFINRMNRETNMFQHLTKVLQADTLVAEGRLDEAIASLDGLIAIAPQYDEQFVIRARAYRLKGEIMKAAADLDHVIAGQGSNSAEAYYERALVDRGLGQPDRALADLRDALARDPKLGSAYYQRALIKLEQKDSKGALQDLDKAMVENEPRASWLTARARIKMFDLGQSVPAADDFASAAERAIAYREAMSILGGSDASKRPLMEPGQSFDPGGYYLLLWAHAARVFAGQDDREEMQKLKSGISSAALRRQLTEDPMRSFANVDAQAMSIWPAPLYRMFLGQISADEVSSIAAKLPEGGRSKSDCDLNFYIAIYDLENKKTEAAKAGFDAAVANCPSDSLERDFALLPRNGANSGR